MTAAIFDLDGTLTVSTLDFDAIRAEIGLASGPILEAMQHMTGPQRVAAEEILARHEERAANDSSIRDGARETLEELRCRGHRIGVFTRNARRWSDITLERLGLVIDEIRTRDDGEVKPSPWAVRSLCEAFGVDPRTSWVVGDYQFDLESGRAAGATTVLLLEPDEAVPEYAALADHVIRDLRRVLDLIAS